MDVIIKNIISVFKVTFDQFIALLLVNNSINFFQNNRTEPKLYITTAQLTKWTHHALLFLIAFC